MTSDTSSPLAGLPPSWVRAGLVVALAALAALAILPGYGTGQWPWHSPPQVPNLETLQTLPNQPLALPGWVPISHQVVAINQQDWILSEYAAPAAAGPPLTQPPSAQTAGKSQASGTPTSPQPPVSQVALLMHPQPWHSDQPELEWLNLNGAQNLKTTQRQHIALTTTFNQTPTTATARLVHSRNQHNTFALVQWYAWPGGGHPSPRAWFWVNQWSQLTSHTLTPWVAVALLIPIAPLADVTAYQPLAVELASTIQQQLASTVFAEGAAR